jgi:HK97 family phage prohead protease
MGIEYRVAGELDKSSGKLSGTAVPFNRETIIGDLRRGGFREKFAPGAFTSWLASNDVVLLAYHDTGKPVARMSIGSLRVRQLDDAVHWEADPNNTSYANDLVENIRTGVVNGTSFGFKPLKERWTDDDGNPASPATGTNREVIEAELPEISPVTFPQYTGTQVSARDAINAARETRAAKATYSDIYTCGSCGATSQYGSYCADCGQPMSEPTPDGKFCTSCGSELGDDRASHVCEKRETENPKPAVNESDTSGSDRSKVSILARRAALESKRYV